MLVKKCGWSIQKSLFGWTNQDSTFSHTREFENVSHNFKIFEHF